MFSKNTRNAAKYFLKIFNCRDGDHWDLAGDRDCGKPKYWECNYTRTIVCVDLNVIVRKKILELNARLTHYSSQRPKQPDNFDEILQAKAYWRKYLVVKYLSGHITNKSPSNIL